MFRDGSECETLSYWYFCRRSNCVVLKIKLLHDKTNAFCFFFYFFRVCVMVLVSISVSHTYLMTFFFSAVTFFPSFCYSSLVLHSVFELSLNISDFLAFENFSLSLWAKKTIWIFASWFENVFHTDKIHAKWIEATKDETTMNRLP